MRHISFPKSHRSYSWIAALSGVVMIARVLSTMHVYNNTVDEPYHIGSAIVLWEAKQLVVGAQHPPLARWVIGLPLALQGVSFPKARGEYVVVEFPGFGIGQEILFSGKLPYWRMLISARCSLLIFSILALFYVYRLGRYLASPLVGMLATVSLSFDPTFLAHSGLVGTDVAGCAGFVAGFYYLLRYIAKPRAERAAVTGIAVGLALSCKLSCALLIPLFVLLVIAKRIRKYGHRDTEGTEIKREKRGKKTIQSSLHSVPSVSLRQTVSHLSNRQKFPSRKPIHHGRLIAFMAIISFGVLWATYGFAVNPMRQQAMLVNERAWTSLPDIIREQPIPMPSFFLGQIFLAARAVTGHPTYLNGQVSYDGWLMYFPEALAVKEPVGFLLAMLAAMAIFVIKPKSFRSILLLIPIIMFLAISMRSRYQLGIRHLLPILPLMYLFAVMQLCRVRWQILLIGLMLLAGVETAAVHPDYLAFFNFISGGATRGERYLIDSNLDWGQDVARLASWLKSDEAKGRPYTIRCAFVTPSLLAELGLDPSTLTQPPHGLFAISKNVLHRLDASQREQGSAAIGEDYSWLARYPVVKRIGYSIDVYDLDAKGSSPK